MINCSKTLQSARNPPWHGQSVPKIVINTLNKNGINKLEQIHLCRDYVCPTRQKKKTEHGNLLQSEFTACAIFPFVFLLLFFFFYRFVKFEYGCYFAV